MRIYMPIYAQGLIIYLMKANIFLVLTLLILGSVNSYDIHIARQLIYMSSISYDSTDQINGWNCPECSAYSVANQKAFTKNSVQGFTAFSKTHNAILVVFRGSANIGNWITNLATTQTTYPLCSNCKVHTGFYSAYTDIAPTVRTHVQQLLSLYRSAPIYVTGHSLGGALAVLCALDLKTIHGNIHNLYTMGQPRVGNANFASNLESQIPNTFRLINNNDIVPHIPPSSFSFKHGGHEVWYTNSMQTYKICVSEDPACVNSVNALKYSTDDHSISNYEKIKVSLSWAEYWSNYFGLDHKKLDYEEIDQVSFEQMELNGVNNVIQKLKIEQEKEANKVSEIME